MDDSSQLDPVVNLSGWDALRGGRVWAVAVAVLGLSLWAQLFLIGLLAEGQFDAPRPWAMIAYLMPIGLLATGVWSRAPVVLLTLFMTSFLPGLVLLPEQEKLLLAEGASMLRIGLTLTLFLAVASAGSGPEVEQATSTEPLGVDVHDEGAIVRRFVLARLGVLVLLFVVPGWAVFLDPSIASALSRNYPDAPHVARTFLGLVHFFVWSVAAYMMVLVPALNVEYDHRRLSRTLREQYDDLSRRAIGMRAAAWAALSAGMILAAWLLT